MNPQDYQDAMSAVTGPDAAAWMAERIDAFMRHWQHERMGREGARHLICLTLAYFAGKEGAAAQERVYQLYGALHPAVLCMTKEQRKGRQFLHEFSQEEIRQAVDCYIEANMCGRKLPLPEGAQA
jgi:hypothetical protein